MKVDKEPTVGFFGDDAVDIFFLGDLIGTKPSQLVISNSSVKDIAFWVHTHALTINSTLFPVGYDQLVVDTHEHSHAVGQSLILRNFALVFGVSVVDDKVFACCLGLANIRAV